MNGGAATRQRVAQLEGFGLDDITIVERPMPALERSQVRVKVCAASLNHRDLLVVEGRLSEKTPLPRILLSDCAGEVVEIGSAVERFTIGDRVMAAMIPAWTRGPFDRAFAESMLGSGADGVLGEYVSGDERGFVAAPEGLSFEEAATLPSAALTVWNAFFEQNDLKPGKTVLVLGSGGVSTFALQFALAAGARVIATSGSDWKLERLQELGAAHVINYRTQPEWSRAVLEFTRGAGVDHVIETGGACTLDQSIKSVAVGGTISLIGMLTGAAGSLDTRTILQKALRLQGVVAGSVEMLERMSRTVEALDVRPVIDRTFEMRDVVAALRYLQSGQHVGKVVLRVGGEQG